MTLEELLQALNQGTQDSGQLNAPYSTQYPSPQMPQQQSPQIPSSMPASTVAQVMGQSLNAPSQSQQPPTSKLPASTISQSLQAPSASKPASQQGAGGYSQYKVKSGDTLWGIAQQQLGDGNRWHELEGFHGDPTALQPGTVIHVPGKGATPQQPAKKVQSVGKAPSNVAFGGGLMG